METFGASGQLFKAVKVPSALPTVYTVMILPEVASLSCAIAQTDPDATVTADLCGVLNGNVAATASAPAGGATLTSPSDRSGFQRGQRARRGPPARWD